ncbi:hypothetical protein PC2016_3543 [Pseudoalteromonas carrageenovora]|uniref:Uncharacterized protein n=1 Tax=Pseudoalteromonas carrageenovora IAM 12662 TaxID=1314868 RepID=A0A2K4XER4_PSEVC|nr:MULTISPECIES: hypothetical protein [Pseudoalteromonas]MBB1432332.1 hypothetical protein [Pseudoalteromonas sp. SG43-4]MBE0384445.1 hypothetical protein [Pseudoalteromonas carrageenovora IAM 12662]QBJ73718.1 hypothetical protein PC2016_3543 [Pseudoalteromonas carrageenovora]SOU42828.1 exported protein of unknown function [Pseudoalteromonas carrageenovora IAM 12662]GEB72606.1 hypothetical protein PCA01_33160 [Pseudoalteromonas carrageenovora]
MIKHLLKLAFAGLLFAHTSSFAEIQITEEMKSFTDKANKVEQWQLGTTKRFDTFEQFFLNAGGDAYYQTGYIFDIESEHWLSYEEAIKVAPDLNGVLSQQQLNINITTEELLAYTNIQVPANAHYVYLYFDTPTDPKDGTYLYSEGGAFTKLLIEANKRRKSAALTLQKHATIPWYLIEIPLIGFNPQ